jgi:MFS family permease
VKLLEALVPADFRKAIKGPLRRFYACTFVTCVGMGLTLSLYVVYLHNVRGFSTTFATVLLALSAIAGLCASPLWGTSTDHFGPLRVMVCAYALNAASLVVFAFARTKTEAVVAGLLLAVFGNAGWGPGSTMLSRLVHEDHRQRAFGFNFMLVNLGIGFGGLVSAVIVNLHRPVTFEGLYLFNAGITLATALFLFTLRDYGRPVTEHHSDPVKSTEGWGVVIRDKRLVMVVLATLVLMIGGYGSLDAGFSLFVVNDLHLSVHAIGVMFFFNTTTIVLAQLWVLNRIEAKSRTLVMATTSVLWFVFWMILDAALGLPKFVAIGSLCLAMAIFAVGETMLQPVGPALVNDIAPEHLRGRYNAAQGVTWGVAGSLAPAITGIYFANGLGNWWPLSTGLTALGGGLLMLNLRRHLTAREDGREPSTLGAAE